jgi:hypothetical protein
MENPICRLWGNLGFSVARWTDKSGLHFLLATVWTGNVGEAFFETATQPPIFGRIVFIADDLEA